MITKHEEKLRSIFKSMFSLKADTATPEEIRDRLLSGGKITGTNMCVLICAMIIASVGLNVNSTAVIIGQTRKSLINTIIPGVAIATALMPPLCTCGYSIANGNWKMLSGAANLFVINAYFIMMSSAVILSLLKIPRVRELTEKEWKRLRFRMIRNTVIVLIPSIILAVVTFVQNG